MAERKEEKEVKSHQVQEPEAKREQILMPVARLCVCACNAADVRQERRKWLPAQKELTKHLPMLQQTADPCNRV